MPPGTRISGLTEGTPAADDLVEYVAVADPPAGRAGVNRKARVSSLPFEAAGAVAAAAAAHLAAGDPHPQYVTAAAVAAAYQPRDADLTALAALATTAYGRGLTALADAAAARVALGLGTAAVLAADADTGLAANSDAAVPTQRAVKAYVDSSVTGLLDLKGSLNCGANPNYPAASKGDAYYVSVAGRVGGGAGPAVDVGDVVAALADNAGGTAGAVGASWFILEHNLAGALVAANNLSDLTNDTLARDNLGIGSQSNLWQTGIVQFVFPDCDDDVLVTGTDDPTATGVFVRDGGATVASMTADGVVTAAAFVGDGSGLTGLSGGGSPGGSAGQLQWNSAGAFAGAAALAYATAGTHLTATAQAAGVVPLAVALHASQSVAGLEVRTSGGVVRFAVDATGVPSCPVTTGTSFPGERYGKDAAPGVTAGTVGTTAIGQLAGNGLTSGTHNTLVGFQAGSAVTTGADNTVVGSQVQIPAASSGAVAVGRQHDITTADSPLAIGVAGRVYHSRSGAIGRLAWTTKANQLVLSRDWAAVTMTAETSTDNRPVAELQRALADSTDATRAGRLSLHAYYTTTAQEGVRVEANAGGVRLGFYGAAAVTRPTLPYAGTVTGADLRTALLSLGLCV